MNIQTSLLPHKHVKFCESTLAVAGLVRSLLVEPRSVDELWALVDQRASGPIRPSFTQLVLAIDLLFAIKQIQSSPDGRVSKAGIAP